MASVLDSYVGRSRTAKLLSQRTQRAGVVLRGFAALNPVCDGVKGGAESHDESPRIARQSLCSTQAARSSRDKSFQAPQGLPQRASATRAIREPTRLTAASISRGSVLSVRGGKRPNVVAIRSNR